MTRTAVLFDLDDTLIRFPSRRASAFLLWHATRQLGTLFSEHRPHFATPFAARVLAEARRNLLRERAYVPHGAHEGVETNIESHWTLCLQEALERLGLMEAHEHDIGRLMHAFFQGAFARTARATIEAFPSMVSLVREARDQGTSVVLATNPLVPRVAVEQRLARAGLAPSDFDHMTHSGNSRFLKPSAYYYADILRTLDLPAGSVAMIGNDPVRDGAARQVGIRTLIVAPARDENRAAEQVRAFLRGA